MLRIVRGQQPATDFQKTFARAGHAHAGVFVIFALIAQVFADAGHLHAAANTLARDGIWAAAILFPAEFFPLISQAKAPPDQTSSSCSCSSAPSPSRPECSLSESDCSPHERTDNDPISARRTAARPDLSWRPSGRPIRDSPDAQQTRLGCYQSANRAEAPRTGWKTSMLATRRAPDTQH